MTDISDKPILKVSSSGLGLGQAHTQKSIENMDQIGGNTLVSNATDG
jgi:hypothetical protein